MNTHRPGAQESAAAPQPQAETDDAHAGVRQGLAATRSLAVGAFVFGVLFGSAAHAAGLAAWLALFMSAAVFAGGAQFAALELWEAPLPLVAIALSTAVIGSRHILMGLTLEPILRPARPLTRYVALAFLTDANWVLTVTTKDTAHRLAFFMTSGIIMAVVWIAGTVIGIALPALLDATTVRGIAFGGVVFLTLLLLMFLKRHAGPKSPVFVAAGAAVIFAQIASPDYAVLAGVGGGAVTSLLLRRRVRRG